MLHCLLIDYFFYNFISSFRKTFLTYIVIGLLGAFRSSMHFGIVFQHTCARLLFSAFFPINIVGILSQRYPSSHQHGCSGCPHVQFDNGKKVLRLISNSPYSSGVLCLVNVLLSSSTFSQCLFHIQRLFEQIFTRSFSREITFFVESKCMEAKLAYIYTYSINKNVLVLKEYMARP